ncbi:MAG: hypothetical protein JJU37_01115 [Balneolaceae bacterium]|nr:hypothetical protein [Balneolaceae bacterium]
MKKTSSKITGMLVLAMLVMSSCNIFDSGSKSSGTEPLGGELSEMGAVGNTFTAPINGTFEIIAREGDISTLQATATISNPAHLAILGQIQSPNLQVNGNQVTLRERLRITSKGIQNVSEDGKKQISLVEYGAKKGDKYKLKGQRGTTERTVTRVSSEDDYFWGWMYIKTIQIEEKTNYLPGISKVVYYANHRFGLVGVDIHFEDGSDMLMNVYSSN